MLHNDEREEKADHIFNNQASAILYLPIDIYKSSYKL